MMMVGAKPGALVVSGLAKSDMMEGSLLGPPPRIHDHQNGDGDDNDD